MRTTDAAAMNKVQVVLGVVAAAGVIGGGFFIGDHQGQELGGNARSLASPRLRIEKLSARAVDDEQAAAVLLPQNAALQASINALEAKHAGLLDKLREARQVECSPADPAAPFQLRFTPARTASATVVAVAESLRAGLLSALNASAGQEQRSDLSVSVDVFDFGEVTAGPCKSARLVRTTFTESWVEFNQNCDKGDGSCNDTEPPPTFYEDDVWGCVRESRTHLKSIAEPAHCIPDEEHDDTSSETPKSLYWLVRDKELIYLPSMSAGWGELAAQEVAPGQANEQTLGVVLRFDSETKVELPTFPDAYRFPGNGQRVLKRVGEEKGTHTGFDDVVARLDNGLVLSRSGDTYLMVSPDGFSADYVPDFDVPVNYTLVTPKAGVEGLVFGSDYFCAAIDHDKVSLKRVATHGDSPVYVPGKIEPGVVKALFWESPFGSLFRCSNRDVAPFPRAIPDEEPWESQMTDEKRRECQMSEPLIYLYPTHALDVDVRLSPTVKLTAARPDYGHDGWKVHAEPGGHLRNLATGLKLDAIFWEGHSDDVAVPTSGTVLARDDVAAFLAGALPRLGLSPREAHDFRAYWQPKLERPEFVLVRFLDPQEIDDLAPLEIVPPADVVLRVMLDFWPLDRRIDVPPQRWSVPPKREGFVAVEWGGLLRKETLRSIAPVALDGAR